MCRIDDWSRVVGGAAHCSGTCHIRERISDSHLVGDIHACNHDSQEQNERERSNECKFHHALGTRIPCAHRSPERLLRKASVAATSVGLGFVVGGLTAP